MCTWPQQLDSGEAPWCTVSAPTVSSVMRRRGAAVLDRRRPVRGGQRRLRPRAGRLRHRRAAAGAPGPRRRRLPQRRRFRCAAQRSTDSVEAEHGHRVHQVADARFVLARKPAAQGRENPSAAKTSTPEAADAGGMVCLVWLRLIARADSARHVRHCARESGTACREMNTAPRR